MRIVALTLALVWSCGTPPEAAPGCLHPESGCFCDQEGARKPCFLDPEMRGGDMVCHVGTHVCDDGVWSACEDVHEEVRGSAAALVGAPSQCNPCNPNCFVATNGPIVDDDLDDENSDNVAYNPETGALESTGREAGTETRTVGPGGDEPFDIDGDHADGVELTPDGAITLGSSRNTADNIWIANTSEGTISRFNIATFEETGRFWVGPHGRGNDPSRTSVNTAGDAYVTGRRGNFISRISTLGEVCPDTNGDGEVTTSLNGTALAWGQDDCVVWTTDLRPVFPRGYIRAVAAQDLVDPDTGDVREFVWVGGYGDRRIALLDGATGRLLMVTYVGVRPYGFALDGAGNLWISTIHDRRLVRVDTNRCNADGCPWDARCIERRSDSTACDGAIKQLIPTPDSNRPYGITVDSEQRIWVGGDRDVQRYDRSARTRWSTAGIGRSGGWKAGVAADGSGNVWTTGSFGVWRINADNPRQRYLIRRNSASRNARGWGVAIDAQDRAWVIGRWENFAWVFEPGDRLDEFSVERVANTVRNPYTYSDMTGQQLRLAATPRGTYIMTFEGCGGSTEWQSLAFDVDTPSTTTVGFRIRTASTQAELAGARWVGVGVAPSAGSPIDVRTPLLREGIQPGRFAQVEVALQSTVTREEVFTPTVRSVSLEHSCIRAEPGHFERDYDATTTCTIPPERPFWGALEYRAETPGDSFIEVLVRTAETVDDLDGATDTAVTIPALPDEGTVSVDELLRTAGMPISEAALRVRMRLIPDSRSGQSARLYDMAMQWDCIPSE
ncbi:MAG: hypothetical protein AAGE52_22615 [Myxococcota bacterium]